MTPLLQRARLAVVAGAGLALLLSGVVAGAAGQAIIMGASNNAGTSNTSLTTNSSGTAWYVYQNGSGTAMRANATATDAIAGFYTSANGPGISGVTANATKYGVYAANDAATSNGGAALRASGQQNEAIVATSAEDTAIVGTATGCTGFLCGSSGVRGTGAGFAAGVTGIGEGSIAGVWGSAGASGYGVFASSSVVNAPAALTSNGSGIGVSGQGQAGDGTHSCVDLWCAGGDFSGLNGAVGYTATAGGYGLYGADDTGTDSAYGVTSGGDAWVMGDLYVDGTIFGSALTALAINDSATTLNAGDAVTAVGVTTGADGQMVLKVAPAKKGDEVAGIVGAGVAANPSSVKVPASKQTIDTEYGPLEVSSPARTLEAQASGYKVKGTTAAGGAMLQLVIYGAVAFEGSVDATVGDSLAVGDEAGKIGKADQAQGPTVGKYLGSPKKGVVAVFVNPD